MSRRRAPLLRLAAPHGPARAACALLFGLSSAGGALAASVVPAPPDLAAGAAPAGYTVIETLAPSPASVGRTLKEAGAVASSAPSGPGGPVDRVCAEDRPEAPEGGRAEGRPEDRRDRPATRSAPEAPAVAPAPMRPALRGRATEPAVSCRVFETEAGRIEERRVRGQLQRVRVEPVGGGRPYELQLLDAGRDPAAKSGSGRGGEGQRVWPVLSF